MLQVDYHRETAHHWSASITNVDLLRCAASSDGITVPTELGDVAVKCDANGVGISQFV
jgi:hypothetical protein